MPFPWGGKVTYSQLAEKFSWPTVIISIILTPLLLVWSKLLAYPIWLIGPFKNGPLYMMKYNFSYPDKENAFLSEAYDGFTPTTRRCCPDGWTCLTDYEGGKFFEAFWGLIQVADMDVNDDRIIISPNWKSWAPVSNIFIERPTAPVHEHQARFYFPIMGLNLINPFNWVSQTWTGSAFFWYGFVSNTEFCKKNGISSHLSILPKAEDPAKIHKDLSMTYESPTANGSKGDSESPEQFQDGYGSMK